MNRINSYKRSPRFLAFWGSLALGLFLTGLLASASMASTCANRALGNVKMAEEREIAVLCETNTFRKQEGVSPLKLDPVLSAVARAHAKDMSDRDYFDHTNPEGLSPSDRIKASGHDDYKGIGENIALGYRTPGGVVEGWIDSPGHKANMLGIDYKSLGVGIYGNLYVQLFSRSDHAVDGITGLEPEYQGAPAPGISGFRVVSTGKRNFRIIAGLAAGQRMTVMTRFGKRICQRRAGKRRCHQGWSKSNRRAIEISGDRLFTINAKRGSRVKVKFVMPRFQLDGATYRAWSRTFTRR